MEKTAPRNQATTCYIFSGLGADERVFQEIDFGSFSPVFIPWEPVQPDQSFASYVQQLSHRVTTDSPLLIGISFGGMVAQEMSTLFGDCPVLIISSVRTRAELPLLMRFGGKIGLHKLIPVRRVLANKWLNYRFFGTKTEQEKRILDQILADSDPVYTKWAIHTIVNWKRRQAVPANVLHIHGDADRIFRIGNVHPDYVIREGTHFMTVSKHREVSIAIQDALNKLASCNS